MYGLSSSASTSGSLTIDTINLKSYTSHYTDNSSTLLFTLKTAIIKNLDLSKLSTFSWISDQPFTINVVT